MSGNISISNTPSINVIKTTQDPVPVRDTFVQEPVNGSCQATTHGGATSCIAYTVPVGKRLVVETISYQFVGDSAHQPWRLITGQGNQYVKLDPLNDLNIFLSSPGQPSDVAGGFKVWLGTHAVKIYLDEGKTLQGQADFNTPTLDFPNIFMFSGYLTSK